MSALWHHARLGLLAAGALAYILAGYLASSSTHPPVLAVLIGAVPFIAGIFTAAWHSPLRYPALALSVLAVAAVALNFDQLLQHASWLYFIQHVGAMGALAIMFGCTLGSIEGALCSRVAKIAIAETLDRHYLRYTWKVTVAWTVYFIVCGLISTGLFFLSSLTSWAFFAAVVTPISVGAMFVAEFLIRLRALPGRPHFSIAQTIRSYREYTLRKSGTA